MLVDGVVDKSYVPYLATVRKILAYLILVGIVRQVLHKNSCTGDLGGVYLAFKNLKIEYPYFLPFP